MRCQVALPKLRQASAKSSKPGTIDDKCHAPAQGLQLQSPSLHRRFVLGNIVQLPTNFVPVGLGQRTEQGDVRRYEIAFRWEMLFSKLIEIRLCFVLQSGGEDQRLHILSIDARLSFCDFAINAGYGTC